LLDELDCTTYNFAPQKHAILAAQNSKMNRVLASNSTLLSTVLKKSTKIAGNSVIKAFMPNLRQQPEFP